MRLLHASALVAVVVSGCVSSAQTTPDYGGEYAGVSSGPDDPNYYGESTWVGPPGGAIDPGYGYGDPNSPSGQTTDPSLAALDPAAYGGDMYGGQTYGNAWVDPSAPTDPNAIGTWTGATADVTDAEIDVTLNAYGEWVEDADYGSVWRPYTTVVGTDFTPYESCGQWVYTDYGWTFQSCDEWSWGWLPFHYGNWVYLDEGWCWSRDYSWGPGYVDWRSGGDYVGWRPTRPTRIHDHRHPDRGRQIHDHRHEPPRWHFSHTPDFGRRPIRTHLSVDEREGLRATTTVAQPPVRGDVRNRASSVMAGRLRDHQRADLRTGAIGQSTRGYQPTRGYNVGGVAPTRGYNVGPRRGYNVSGNQRPYNPTYDPAATNPSRPTWQSNRRWNGSGYNPPRPQPWNGARTYNSPSPTWGGARGYNPPAGPRPSPTWGGGSSWGGSRGSTPPSRPSSTWGGSPPSRPSSSWGGSRGSAPPASSRPSSSWGGHGSSSSPSSSWGGSRGSSSSPSSSSWGGSRGSSSSPSSSSWGGSRGSSSSPSSSSSSRGSSSSSSGSSSGGSRGSSSSSSSSGGGSHGGGGHHR